MFYLFIFVYYEITQNTINIKTILHIYLLGMFMDGEQRSMRDYRSSNSECRMPSGA